MEKTLEFVLWPKSTNVDSIYVLSFKSALLLRNPKLIDKCLAVGKKVIKKR